MSSLANKENLAKWENERSKMRRALEICKVLANTNPSDWLSKTKIHAELAEFKD